MFLPTLNKDYVCMYVCMNVLAPDMLFSWGDWATSYTQEKRRTWGGICNCKVLSCQKSMCGGWRGAWAPAGWRVWYLGNGTIILWMAISEKTSNLQKMLKFYCVRSKCFGKELPPLSLFICKPPKNFCRARKSLGTSLALQCYAGLVSSTDWRQFFMRLSCCWLWISS